MADVSEASAQIELLDQNLKKTHVLSSRMTGILTHFDTRLNRLERTILPLHNSTQSLTRLSNNIDATLAALSSVRVNQEKTMSDEAALMSPPNPTNLAPYMATLNRTLEHIDDLKESGLRGEVGVKEKAKLAETGYKQLCSVLIKHLSDGSTGSVDVKEVRRSPPSPSRLLSTHSLIATSSLPTYLLSPRLSKLSKPNAQQLEDTLLTWSSLRSSFLLRGIEAYGRQAPVSTLPEGVLACAQAEHSLLLSLLPAQSPTIPIVLAQILTPSVEYMSQTLVTAAQGLKKEPLPWKAYALYEGLDAVSIGWTAFVREVGFGGAPGGQVVKDALKEVMGGGLKGLCLRSLPEAVEGAKIAPMLRPGEAPSVAVSANTIDTVAYLLKLPEHQETIENFLNQLGDRKWLMGAAASVAAVGDDDEGVLEHFVFDVAAALIGALESRARNMRKGVGAIFLVNNIAYVRDNLLLSNSSVSDLLGDSGENLLNKAFRSAKAGYLDLFTELLLNLTDPSSTSTPNTSSRLNPLKTTSDQDRQVTKDGFTRFWDTLEGIEGVHRMNKLADSGEVKDRLRGEVKEKVGGGYKKAVIKWGGSLGPKYIRCTPDDLEHRIVAIYN